MIVLALDTCGAVGSVALGRLGQDGAAELLGTREIPGRETAASLLPAIGELVHAAGMSPAQIRAVLAVDGPGGFTGVRIGLATAKGLAEGTGAPLFAVSRLRVLALANGADAAALDAGRGELYLGTGYMGSGMAVEALLLPGEVPATLGTVAVCEPRVEALLAGRARLVPAPMALDALRVAGASILAGEVADPMLLDGRYLRREDLYRLQQSVAGG